METPKRYRLWLVGLALGVLIALLIVPATQWLIRSQLVLSVPLRPSVVPFRQSGEQFTTAATAGEAQALHAAAARHPNDYAIQLADVLMSSPGVDRAASDAKVTRLRTLTARFPNSPSLRASILRFASLHQIHIQEPDVATMQASRVPPEDRDTPEQLAAFDQEAAEGERLDPENAYFPLMRAAGLLAAQRSTEALEAVHRAAEKPRWDDYAYEEPVGEWRLQEEAFGNRSGILRVGTVAAVLMPHYAKVRVVARVSLHAAIEAEKRGQIEEGLSLRHALMECGSLMITQSHNYIGSLVGGAIVSIGMEQPEGRKPPKFDQSLTWEQRQEIPARIYEGYLRRVGHADEIPLVRAQVTARKQVLAVRFALDEQSCFGRPLKQLISLWAVDLFALSNIFWILVFGGLAALLAQNRRLRAGQPLPRYAQWGVGFGLVAGVIVIVGVLLQNLIADALLTVGLVYPYVTLPRFCCIALTLALFILLIPNLSRSDRLRCLGVFTLTTLSLLLCAWLYLWQTHGAAPLAQLCRDLISGGEEGSVHHVLTWMDCMPLFGGTVVALTFLTVGTLSLIFRVPLSAGLVRGFSGLAVPVACVLFLGYAGLILVTLRHEAEIDYGLNRTLQHEGRYLAELSGKEWPGPAR